MRRAYRWEGIGLYQIVLLLVVCARVNHLFILPARLHCPSWCNNLHGYWAIYDPPSTALLYAIHHTILVITISRKGQGGTHVGALEFGAGHVHPLVQRELEDGLVGERARRAAALPAVWPRVTPR